MSLRTIRLSLLARLQTLLTTASPPGYVSAVALVAGDRQSRAKIEEAALVADNIVTLSRESVRLSKPKSITTLTAASSRAVFITRWRVSIVVRDVRDKETALTAANTGVDALYDAVLSKLDGYEASGLALNTRVRFAGDEPEQHRPGRYLAVLFFETEHLHDADDTTDAGEEPLVVNADVNLEGQADAEPNPVAQLTTE